MKRRLVRVLVLLGITFFAGVSSAADYTWTGAGDGTTWTDLNNWEGNAKFVSSTTNRLIFKSQVENAVVTLPSSIYVNRIKFAAGCKAMRLTSANGAKITNTYIAEELTDSNTDKYASIFDETTEPIVIDLIQVMTGGRSVGLAQGAHLEILKPIADIASRKGRIYFRTLGASKNSYLKIDYDPSTVEYPLDPVEGDFLFYFVGGTNEISSALCSTVRTSPKPISSSSLGMLKLNAGTYPRIINVDGKGAVLETVGEVTFATNVYVASSSSTLNFGGAVAFSRKLKYTYTDSSVISHDINFSGNASFAEDVTIAKGAGAYLFELASGANVDFYGDVSLGGTTLEQHIPSNSSISYHGKLYCNNFTDDNNGEPSVRGGMIHLYAAVVANTFYLRGFNITCHAQNVLPATKPITWRYEASSKCAILDMNGFDQTTTHLNMIGSYCGTDRNYITSAKPCTLTINDTYADADPTRARVGLRGAIAIVHGGTQVQVFLSSDIATTEDITINSGTIRLSGSSAIHHTKNIYIDATGELELAGTSETPIPSDTAIWVASAGGGLVVTNYQNASLTLSNRIYVDGELLTNGTYTAENASWLHGSKVTVTANYPAIWRKAADGNWTNVTKWTRMPEAQEAAYLDINGNDYTVSITQDNAALGAITITNATGTATLAVNAAISWPAWSTVTISDGGRMLVGSDGNVNYNSYTHSGDNFVLNAGGLLEIKDGGTVKIATQEYNPIIQKGGDIIVSGTSKLTFEGRPNVYLGSGKTVLKDSAVLEFATGKNKAGARLTDLRFYTATTCAGVTNHLVFQDSARLYANSTFDLDQVIFGFPESRKDSLTRVDYMSSAVSDFMNQIEIGATWGYAEMNVTAGNVVTHSYGIGVGGFHYDGRTVTDANVVGILNVAGGVVDVASWNFDTTKNRVRGLLLGEGWYDKKTATSQNLFTGYVNLSDGIISNRCGAVILGAGAAKGVWTQTGGRFENTSTATKGPMILGWLGGEGTFILSNGTVNVTSQKIATYVGGAETNLTPWVLDANAPSSADAATGLLSLQGGSFTTAGDVVVGQDGNGTIEVGVSGMLNARSLQLNVAASQESAPAHSATLKFTAGATTCGRIALTGSMTSHRDAQLVFDLTDWDGTSRLKFLTCTGMAGDPVDWGNVTFAGVQKEDFENAGGSRYVFRQTATGISIGKMYGTVLYIR